MCDGNSHTEANSTIRVPNAKFKATKASFPAKKGKRNNGITASCHFVPDWRLGVGEVMAQHIPCACNFCTKQLELPWDSAIQDVSWQERHKNLTRVQANIGDLDAWKATEINGGSAGHVQ